MNDQQRAAMRCALEALEEAHTVIEHRQDVRKREEAITALREALSEQAEQEPVAWRVRGYNQFKTGDPAPWRYVDGADKPAVNKPDCCDFEPLYAAPVRTKDLTDDVNRLKRIAMIAHYGGLANMTKDDALTAIRKITIPYFDRDASDEEARAVIMDKNK